MRRFCQALLPACALLAGSTNASADMILFANLTTSQETIPINPTTSTGAPRPEPFGVAFFTLNDAMTSMSFTATIFNIDFTGSQTADTFDNLVNAHIHASATVTPTTNAPVVWGFFGAPFNDNNPNDVVTLAFFTGVGGMISGKWDAPEGNNTTLAAQLANILAGRSYINFHTVQFPGGEIRGQIIPTPEPATLMLVGLPALALVRNRLKRREQNR